MKTVRTLYLDKEKYFINIKLLYIDDHEKYLTLINIKSVISSIMNKYKITLNAKLRI
jgi:hypothetical protein